MKLIRSLGVGALATAVDLAALAILVELVGVPPALANVPALLAGAVVQFFGCRYFAFQSGSEPVATQVRGFLLTEIGTLSLNAIVFHLLITLSPIPYVLCRPLGQFVTFFGFSYPMWRIVFRAA